MNRTTLILNLLVLTGCVLALSAHGVSAAPGVLSASGAEHAWVVLPGAEDRAMVMHIPGDALSGTVRRVPNVFTQPIAIGAHEDELLLAYEGGRSSGEQVYSIRRVRITSVPGSDLPGYTRPVALPPLIVGGELIDLAQFGDAIWALVRIGERAIAYRFEQSAGTWESLVLPEQLERADELYFPIGSSEPRIFARQSGLAPGIWRYVQEWSLEHTLIPPAPVVYVDGSAYTVAQDANGEIAFRKYGNERYGFTAIDTQGVPLDSIAVATLTGRIVLLWETESPASGSLVGPVHTAVVSTNAGILYDSPARTAPPVTTRQLEVLAFVVLSVAFAVGVFVLHPIRGNDAVVNLPPSASLAPPSRRVFAVLFDAMPAVYAASWIWDKPLDEVLSVGVVLTGNEGIRPLLTAGLVLLVHSAFSEAMWGRTLGKWMTGCRTISRRGGRPSLRVAILRNAMKVLCPPVALMSILNPGVPWPGSFGTFVIMLSTGDEDDQRDPDPSRRDPDEGEESEEGKPGG